MIGKEEMTDICLIRHGENTYLTNACLSNIHFRDQKWEIKDYNIVTHLQL